MHIDVNSTNEASIILSNSSAKDATDQLAAQLLAARLGSLVPPNDATCLASTFTAADNLLSTYGYNTNPQGAARQMMLAAASTLAYWNQTGTCPP
jgi:hypothetical protein